MNQIIPVLSQTINGVNPTGVVGFTPLFLTRAGRDSFVKPAGLDGLKEVNEKLDAAGRPPSAVC